MSSGSSGAPRSDDSRASSAASSGTALHVRYRSARSGSSPEAWRRSRPRCPRRERLSATGSQPRAGSGPRSSPGRCISASTRAVAVRLVGVGKRVQRCHDRVRDPAGGRSTRAAAANERAAADLRTDEAELAQPPVGADRREVVDAGELGELAVRWELLLGGELRRILIALRYVDQLLRQRGLATAFQIRAICLCMTLIYRYMVLRLPESTQDTIQTRQSTMSNHSLN